MAALGFMFHAADYKPRIPIEDDGGDILAGALALASRGIPVFPCKANKTPNTNRGFKDASIDPVTIRGMFARPGSVLIGMATGPASGFIVIDVDRHGDKDGTAWLDENADALPPTLRHGTPSGGCHLVFRQPPDAEIGNSASRIAPGVDVRGEGGYVIAPPSPGYCIIDDAEPADMPVWLAKGCAKADREAAQPVPAPSRDMDSRYAAAALDGECAALMRAPEGTRNDRLNVAAVKLGSYVGGGEISRSTVEMTLTRVAAAIGLDKVETAATIKSGIEHGLTTPRTAPEREAPPPAIHGQAVAPAPETDASEVLDWMCAHSWAALDIPPEPRLLGDLITSTARVFLVGFTGLGKTQLGHAMAVGIASGAGFLHWECERPARVLVVDGEMSKPLLKDRIGSALRRGDPVTARRLVVYGLDRAEEFEARFPALGLFEPLNTAKGQEFMARLINLTKPEVIIFDNVMSLITGDQKDEAPWSETLPLVSKISAMGIGQVWLDHTGWEGTRLYGSNTKSWRMDTVGNLTPVKGVEDGAVAFQISFDPPGKARRRTPANRQDFAPHVITLAGDEWTSEPVGKKVTAGGV